MRLIDADAYKALHCKECPSDCGVCGLVYGKDDICGLIDKAPTIDAVPVVRCKYCEFFGLNDENVPYCSNPFGLDDPEPNGFCNYGV
jgi:hypothetical protein